MKKALKMIFVLCLLTILAACGRNEEPEATPAPAEATATPAPAVATPTPTTDETEDEPTEFELLSTIEDGARLRLAWWGGQTRHDMTMEAVDIFEELTGIPVDIEFYSWDDYFTMLATQAAAGMLPDVMQHVVAQSRSYYDANLILNLQPWVDAGVLDLSDYEEGLLGFGRFGPNRDVYFVPTGGNVRAMLVNMDAIREANMEIPIPFTYEDLFNMNVHMWDTVGMHGSMWFGLNQYFRPSFFTLNENQDFAWTVDEIYYIFDWARRGDEAGFATTPQQRDERTGGAEDTHFATGDQWFEVMPANATAGVLSVIDFEAQFFPMPVHPSFPQPFEFAPTMYWTIAANTQFPNAAIQLMDNLLHNYEIMSMFITDRGMPGSQRVRDMINPHFGEGARLLAQAIEVNSQHGLINPVWHGFVDPPWTGAVNAVIQQHIEYVTYFAMTPREAAEALVAEVEALIERHRAEN